MELPLSPPRSPTSQRTIERLVPNLGQGAGWVEMPHASPSCGAPPGGAPNPWAGGRQEEQVKAGADAGRRRREAAEAAATPEERVLLFAARKDRMRELKKQEARPAQRARGPAARPAAARCAMRAAQPQNAWACPLKMAKRCPATRPWAQLDAVVGRARRCGSNLGVPPGPPGSPRGTPCVLPPAA